MREGASRARPSTGRSLSAAYRIALTYAGAFALAVCALGTGTYLAADAEFRGEQKQSLRTETGELARDFDLDGMAGLRRDIIRREQEDASDNFRYAVFDPTGRRLAGSLQGGTLAPGWYDLNVRPPGKKPDLGPALATRLHTGDILVVAQDTDALESVDRTILFLFAVAFALATVLGLLGALLLARYLRVRLDRISDTATAIAAGQLDRRVPVGRRQDEFDRMGAAINAMLDRIAGLMENLRQVSTDLAHDLRTPLGRVRANLEAGLEQDDPGRLRAATERALRHSDDLLSLFAAILHIAEVERGPGRSTHAPLDLAELASDLVDDYAPAVADGGRMLRLEAEGPVPASADRALLAQALANLIDNAQLHTPPGTAIRVIARADGDLRLLAVADTGPGVPAEDRSRIADRFVRLERSRSTPGHGLGLNMVAAIAAAHGGALEITDNRPGLRATIVMSAAGTGA